MQDQTIFESSLANRKNQYVPVTSSISVFSSNSEVDDNQECWSMELVSTWRSTHPHLKSSLPHLPRLRTIGIFVIQNGEQIMATVPGEGE